MTNLRQLATKADVERQTRILIMWIAGLQFALFISLVCFVAWIR